MPPPLNGPWVLWDLFWYRDARKKHEESRNQLRRQKQVQAAASTAAQQQAESGALRNMLHASLHRQQLQDAATLDSIALAIPEHMNRAREEQAESLGKLRALIDQVAQRVGHEGEQKRSSAATGAAGLPQTLAAPAATLPPAKAEVAPVAVPPLATGVLPSARAALASLMPGSQRSAPQPARQLELPPSHGRTASTDKSDPTMEA